MAWSSAAIVTYDAALYPFAISYVEILFSGPSSHAILSLNFASAVT